MSLRNRSVLVTGGAGFIGSHLVDLLAERFPERLTVVDNLFLGKERNLALARERHPALRFERLDVTNAVAMRQLLDEEGVDVVFDLATIPLLSSLENPRWSYEHNVAMAVTLAELGREGAYRTIVHFSSSEAYGSAVRVPMDEEHPMRPTTPYAASKAAGDHVFESYIRTFGLDAAILRPFNNYGPRQNEGSYAGLIPLTIKRVLAGEPPVMHGDGLQTRDYLYVTDTVRAALAVYETKATRGASINVASGQEVTVREILDELVRQTGCTLPIRQEPARAGDVRRHLGSVEKAKALLGWKPEVSLAEGLHRTVAWYLETLAPGASPAPRKG